MAFPAIFYVDVRYPSILYTNEYGAYFFANRPAFIIGGAFSIDKELRLAWEKSGRVDHPLWFEDEQLTENERIAAKAEYIAFTALHNKKNILLLTHTCPLSAIPAIPLKDSNLTTERFLDDVAAYEPSPNFQPWSHWYCGHWHIDRINGAYRFLYHDIILLEPYKEVPNV